MIVGDPLSFDQGAIPIDQDRVAHLERDTEDQGHYTVNLEALSAFGNEIWQFANTKVILDTGTTLFIVPNTVRDILIRVSNRAS